VWTIVLLLAVVPGCARPPWAEAPLALREIACPAAPGSGEPNLAVTPDGRVLLSWIESVADSRHALRFSALEGDAWSQPRLIAEGGGWFVNWADFPAVAALSDGTLFAHWLEKSGPAAHAYDVKLVSSRDQGQTWAPPVVPHRDGTQAEHGFVSMTPSAAGAMGVVWLDGRKAAAAGHGDHGGGGDETALMHTTADGRGALGPETMLDPRVCDCCQTDVAVTSRGPIVAYRDRSGNETRDIFVVRAADGGWSEPKPVANDGWVINGCPVNGPAIAAAGDRVAVAWFTAPGDKPAVKAALSSDAGASFGPPIVISDARPLGRVDIVLLDGGDALVSWLEQGEGGAAAVNIRRVGADGSLGPAASVAASTGARSSGFARLARSGASVVLAWRDAGDPPKVRTGVLDLAAR
jgi:hypothetical protein